MDGRLLESRYLETDGWIDWMDGLRGGVRTEDWTGSEEGLMVSIVTVGRCCPGNLPEISYISMLNAS